MGGLSQEHMVAIPARTDAPATKIFIKIVYTDEASLKTKPYAIMLPGGPGSNHSFYQDYSCLVDVANIVFYDPRGCGLSEKGESNTYSMQNYIYDLDVVRQYLQLEQMILIGKSYGAMCALFYALTFPEYIERMVLAAGAASNAFYATARENVARRGSKEQQEVCDKLFSGTLKNNAEAAKYFEVMDSMYSYRKRQGLPVDRPTPVYSFAVEPLNQGFAKYLRKYDVSERLHEVQCPTLILCGNEDWVTDPVHSKMMAAGIAKSRLKIYPHCDHSIESDVPSEFFADIRQFLQESDV